MEPQAVFFGEAADEGAVDVQNAPNPALCVDGEDNLRIAGAVAGNVTGELVHIVDQLDGIFGNGSAADSTAYGYADAGGLSLEGAQNQGTIRHFIKADPVDVRHFLPEQGGGIGQICNFVGNAVGERGKLTGSLVIVGFCHKNLPFSRKASAQIEMKVCRQTTAFLVK